MTRYTFTIIAICLLAITFADNASARVLHVDVGVSQPGEGSSWNSAYRYLDEALDYARKGDEIWVAAGTYTPTGSTNREATFQLKENVSLYGGFSGKENRLSQRDFKRNQTILSGDIGNVGKAEDNVYHVVTGADDAVLDGFTITGGYSLNAQRGPSKADDQNRQARQSQQTNRKSGATHTTPDAVMDSASPGDGAGILNFQASPTVRNCVFVNNHAFKGGAAYNMTATKARSNQSNGRSPRFINCVFWKNSAKGRGGAVSNDLRTSPLFLSCVFEENNCDVKGGAMYNDFACSPTIINTLFNNNTARSGAAMGNDGSSSPVIYHSTFTRNVAKDSGPALYQGSGPSNKPSLINSVIWNNQCEFEDNNFYNWQDCSIRVENSVVEGGYTGKNNTSAQPRLNKANVARADVGYKPDDVRFTERNLGQLTLELAPYKIKSSKPGQQQANQSKISTSNRVVYVNYNIASWGDGKSWESAYARLDDGLKDASRDGAEVWVAQGTYVPKGTDRNATFNLTPGVRLYGGFDGSEKQRSQRNPARNNTMLSGDIGKKGRQTDNTYHVITGADKTTLDGFTITGGYADGTFYDSRGGGLVNAPRIVDGKGQTQGYTMTVNDCRFENNHADEGGAVFSFGKSNSTFKDCAFTNNSARNGAAVVDRVGPISTYTNCTFTNNKAIWRGGAMYFDYGARPTIERCSFNKNETNGHGGAIFSMSRASQIENTVVTVTNGTFNGNTARGDGGAALFHDQTLAEVNNSIFSNNKAGRHGTDIAVTDSSKINGNSNKMDNPVYMSDNAATFNRSTSNTNRSNSNQRNGQPEPSQLLSRMDRNKDQCISKEEARGPLRYRFNKIDRDGNNCLSLEELNQGGPQRDGPPQRTKQFEERDLSSNPTQLSDGLILTTANASPGYTLFSPMGSQYTYLMDLNGNAVKTWRSQGQSTGSVYLLNNGNLLRTTSPRPGTVSTPFNEWRHQWWHRSRGLSRL